MPKVTQFRPTTKAENVIDNYMKQNNIENRSLAINQMLEAFQSEPQQQADWEKKTPEELKKEWLESLKEAAEIQLDCIWGIWEQHGISVLCHKKENRGSKPYVSLPFEICKKCFIANRASIDKERKEKQEKVIQRAYREPAHSSINPNSYPYDHSELDYGRGY